MSETKQHPLVIVFYLDRQLMSNSEIMVPFTEAIDQIIKQKDFNALALFMPTDGEERVECINPVVTPKIEMDKIYRMIDDISKQFGLGEDIKDEENA